MSSGQVICHLSGNLVPGSNLLLAGDNSGRLDPGQTFGLQKTKKKTEIRKEEQKQEEEQEQELELKQEQEQEQ